MIRGVATRTILEMGRAPNPGGPQQRVSAHVIAKAQSFPNSVGPVADPDDEKTTIESAGWEEEASTTVEQGEVAEKIRALGLGDRPEPHREQPRSSTNITSTSGAAMEEPTVDDQRANGAITNLGGMMMTPPPAEPARLIITAGNDAGADIQVIPGKSYTIGRAIDNDVVLTDIAVSRKHFDLKYDGGAWILADRGSGNGTLVNGNVEDAPFMLANGDTIEIGNTIFRFDNANGVTREASSYLADDGEEPSTVAGKPMGGRQAVETPVTLQPVAPQPPAMLLPPAPLPPPQILSRPTRPKTVPPPLPPRARTQSGLPVPQGPLSGGMPTPIYQPLPIQAHANPMMPPMSHQTTAPSGPISASMPSSTMPLPQMAGRAPVATPQNPTILGNDMPRARLPTQQPFPSQPPPLQSMQLQTTIPGGHSAPQSIPPLQGMPYGYPVLGVERPSAPGHAQMLVIAAAHAQGRDAPTTAHVPPTPYQNAVMMPQSQYAQPTVSRRMKMVLGGAALALVAAVATVAIIKAASHDEDAVVTEEIHQPTVKPGPTVTTPKKVAVTPGKSGTTVVPIDSKGNSLTGQPTSPTPTAPLSPTKADEDKKKADDEAKRIAAVRAADDKRKADEDKKKRADEERRTAEAQRQAADEQKRKAAEEERQRKADLATKRAEDEQKRRDAAEQKRRDQLAKRAEDEQRRADEKRRTAEARRQSEEDRKSVV